MCLPCAQLWRCQAGRVAGGNATALGSVQRGQWVASPRTVRLRRRLCLRCPSILVAVPLRMGTNQLAG